MKKVLAILLTVLMVTCLGMTALAAGEFVSSPSNNPAPELVTGTPGSEDCDGKIVIIAFSDRDRLTPEERALLEKAYKDIANSDNLAKLNKDLAKIAKEFGIPEKNLAVSDLFNLSYKGCADHDEHGSYDIVIKADTFKNFVGLMYLSADGWKMVDGAAVKDVNGEYHLNFKAAEFGPYAVVVNSAVITDKNPHTGDTNSVYFFAVLMAVSALAVVVLVKKNKKQAV